MLAAIAVVTLGVAGAGIALVRTFSAAAAAKAAVGEFFTDLEGHRYAEAYQRLCPDTQQRYGAAGFASQVAARPLTGHDFTGELRVNGTPSGTTGTVGVAVHYSDGGSDTRLVRLKRTNDSWQICGTPY
jgi:hypothetical protein